LGFHPAAVVWHHRRNSIRAYWKQQVGYGKAEALLERKWPEKYNRLGHATWAGRLYNGGLMRTFSWGRGRIYYGFWGSAPFQSLYQPAPSVWSSLFLMPEWYLVILALALLGAFGILSKPLVLPALAVAVFGPVVQAGLTTAQARLASAPRSGFGRWKLQAITVFLHLLQPLARLCGRLRQDLAAPGCWDLSYLVLPRAQRFAAWTETGQQPACRLRALEVSLRSGGFPVRRGGEYDRWDLEVRGGRLGAARLLVATEDCPGGRLVRVHSWPRPVGLVLALLFAVLSVVAALGDAWDVAALIGGAALALAAGTLWACGAAMASILRAAEGEGIAKGA
jgi:hypothetical protein